MQLQRYIADRMREVEPGHGAHGMRRTRDAREIEALPGAVLHAGPQHQCQAGAQGRDLLLDILDAQALLARAWDELDELTRGIQPMPADLRGDDVAVG